MSESSGRWLPLSLPRRYMGDLIHLAQQVPTRTLQRTMRLNRVLSARQAAWPRPGWCAIFTKAYAMVAARRPTLRQMYVPFPWAHLYEHPANIATVAVNREFGDDEAVLFAQLHAPEQMTLLDIDRCLRDHKERPLETIDSFRYLLRLSRLPRPVRRAWWWLAANGSGKRQARQLGTFGVNAVASLGASSLEMISPWTTALNYDVFAADGSLDVRVTYDHRVRDAARVARVLEDLEDVLKGEILNELRYLRDVEAA
jgi:hypothetical protein